MFLKVLYHGYFISYDESIELLGINGRYFLLWMFKWIFYHHLSGIPNYEITEKLSVCITPHLMWYFFIINYYEVRVWMFLWMYLKGRYQLSTDSELNGTPNTD